MPELTLNCQLDYIHGCFHSSPLSLLENGLIFLMKALDVNFRNIYFRFCSAFNRYFSGLQKDFLTHTYWNSCIYSVTWWIGNNFLFHIEIWYKNALKSYKKTRIKKNRTQKTFSIFYEDEFFFLYLNWIPFCAWYEKKKETRKE